MLWVDFLVGTYEAPELLRSPSVKASTREREAFFMDYVYALHTQLHADSSKSGSHQQHVPIMLTGGFRSNKGIDDAIRSGVVDMVGIARPFCTEPDRIKSLIDPSFLLDTKKEVIITLVSPILHIPGWTAMDAGLQNLWHQRQIERLACGQEPDVKIGLMYCLLVQSVAAYLISPRRLTHLDVFKLSMYGAIGVAAVTVVVVFIAVVR
jgi:hypothetical protein